MITTCIKFNSGACDNGIPLRRLWHNLKPVLIGDIIAVYKYRVIYIMDDEVKVTVSVQICVSCSIGKRWNIHACLCTGINEGEIM